MDPQKIDNWLTEISKDRQWLADKLGIAIGTLYNGFSKGFKQRSITAITKLMQESENTTSGIEITFSAREFERIEQARALLGIASRKLYYEEAISEYTDRILAAEAEAKKNPLGKTYLFPSQLPAARVAEEPLSDLDQAIEDEAREIDGEDDDESDQQAVG